MEKNIPLLEATMRQIIDHPETHTQAEWRCETGMCFAGWAAVINGAKWRYPESSFDAMVVIDLPGGEKAIEHASTYAEEVLGLSEDEADILFASTNTTEQLQAMVKNLANGDDILDGIKGHELD